MSSLAGIPIVTRRVAVRLGGGGLAAALAVGGQRSAMALDRPTLEANKAIAYRVFDEAINGRNVAVLDEVFSSDFVDRGTWSRQTPGPAGMPLTLDEFNGLFPDVYVTVEAAVAEGDFVATRETWRGTHPPAGAHVVGRTMHVFRIANCQIVECWSAGWDWIETLRGRPPGVNPLIGA